MHGSPAATAPLDRPIPSTWSVEQGRDAYLVENGFTAAAYDEPRTEASFLGIRFTVPNTPRHRWAIMLHDLHHVVTGYGTDLVGEGEISAWEARRGLRPLGLYTGSIVVTGALVGFVAAPRRVWRAWRASPPRGGSLFHDSRPYEEITASNVGQLRERLGVPAEGLCTQPRRLHSHAPKR